MVIDVHTHLGRSDSISARVDELLRSMDQAGIEKSLVFAGRIGALSNEAMLEEIAPHRDRLTGIIAATGLERLAKDSLLAVRLSFFHNVKKWGELLERDDVAGIKFYLGYEHVYPESEAVYRVMHEMQRSGKTAIFHTGDCLCSKGTASAKLKYAHPLGIDDVATDFPDIRIVIAHMGYPWHRDAAEVCYKNSNVFADVSGFVYGKFDERSTKQFERTINEFVDVAGGTDRLLFGSDWPISEQGSYVITAQNFLSGNGTLMDRMQENVRRAFSLGRDDGSK